MVVVWFKCPRYGRVVYGRPPSTGGDLSLCEKKSLQPPAIYFGKLPSMSIIGTQHAA